MKIYGNLINRIMEDGKQKEPKRFMGCTVTAYTDRYPATVIELAYNVVWVREDKATRMDRNGMSDSQRYRYSRNPKGRRWMFKRDRSGRWREAYVSQKTGRVNMSEGGNGLLLGHRDAHHDYSF